MTKFQCRKMRSLTEQLNLFVWNNQWDFRSNNFCQWCLIQDVFWTAHRDCECLRRARQSFLLHWPYGFFYCPFSQLSDIFDPCAHWYCDCLHRAWQSFLCRQWPVGYFCGPFSQLSATVLCSKKLFTGLKICERKSGKNWKNSFC